LEISGDEYATPPRFVHTVTEMLENLRKTAITEDFVLVFVLGSWERWVLWQKDGGGPRRFLRGLPIQLPKMCKKLGYSGNRTN
jgi:hypothetical protein